MQKIILASILLIVFSVSAFSQIKIGNKTINIGKPNSTVGGNSENAQQMEANPAAPDNYDPNFSVGDSALAIDKRWVVTKVTVYAKGSGFYKVVPFGTTEWEIKNKNGVVKTYKSNSLYKDYDIGAFNNDTRQYQRYVEPYLECYAAAFKFPLSYVTGKDKWGNYYISGLKEYDDQLAKLGELWQLIQTKYPNLPNTYAPYDKNPIVWASVAKNRETFVKCLGQQPNDENIKMPLGEIASAKKHVEAYNGSNELYGGGSMDWVWRAVSPKKRQEFFDSQVNLKDFEAFAVKVGKDPKELVNKLNKAFDELKAVAEPKLATYKMQDWYFKYQDAASQTKMKAYLKNPASLKTYKIGVSDETWIIVKNVLGIPLYKYKRGQMLVRNSSDDHPYCKGLFFVIKQTYSGAGTYGASQISEYHEELYGCP